MTEDDNPPIKNDPDYIQVKVVSREGEISFKLKKKAAFGKMFAAFCTRLNKPQDAVRFMFDGKRMKDTSTPIEMDIEDGDVIEAMVEQQGGANVILLID